jgi:hypothetical protein
MSQRSKRWPKFFTLHSNGAQNMILHPSSSSKAHEWKPLWLVFRLSFGPMNFQKHLVGLPWWMGAFVICILTLPIMLIQLSKTFGRVAFMYFDYVLVLKTFKNTWENGFHVFWLCFGPKNLQKHLGEWLSCILTMFWS